ncbi:hypothetical protein Bca101_059140 [Brassica carinata]
MAFVGSAKVSWSVKVMWLSFGFGTLCGVGDSAAFAIMVRAGILEFLYGTGVTALVELRLSQMIIETRLECVSQEIFVATAMTRVHSFSCLLHNTRNWMVLIHSLLSYLAGFTENTNVIHRLLREGDPTFRVELLNFSQRDRILQLSNIKDDSSHIGQLVVNSVNLTASSNLYKRRSQLGITQHRVYAVLRNRSTGDFSFYITQQCVSDIRSYILSHEHSDQAYERYWSLEDEVTEMQKRVVSLQDEFGVGAEIEDGEAKTLVASTALSSCKETIAKLEETQKRFAEDAETEKERIVSATERFEALRKKFEMVKVT